MMSDVVLREERSRTMLLSIRFLKFAVVFLMSWQGSMVSGSILEITDWALFGPINADELYLILLLLLTAVERTVTRDYYVRRSYFMAPGLLLMLGLFISWCRGVFMMERFAVVYEAHEAFLIPIALGIFVNAFRDVKDRWALITVLLLGVLFKSTEGMYIYFFSASEAKTWGVLQMWRDGYLLGLGVLSAMLFAHFKPTRLPRIRRLLLAAIPIIAFSLIMSYRRTFIVAAMVSAVVLIVTIGKGRRRKQTYVLLSALTMLIIVALLTDPLAVLSRLSGIIDPSEEGSAYIRLLELPNVLANIAHNPLWGTAVGTQWKQYFRMPSSAVYTTLGTHNTYLYFPLRTGIIGTIGFFWLLARIWKVLLVNVRLSSGEDQKFTTQLFLHMFVIYQVACFFGLMYGDAMSSLIGLLLVMLQFEMQEISGLRSYAFVDFKATLRARRIVYRTPRLVPWLSRRLLTA